MKTAQAIAAFLGLSVSSVIASEEDIAGWLSVSITAQASKPFEKVDALMEITGLDFNAGIKVLRISCQGHALSFPPEAIAGLRHPLLQTLMISSLAGCDEYPWLYISFELGMPESRRGTAWEPPRVYLAFQNDKFVKRFMSRNRPEGGRTFTDEWRP